LSQALIDRTGWPLVPGAMIAVVALCVLPVLLAMPETRPTRRGAGRSPIRFAPS
jgi:MHS family proline/betaine transporter-like MFS transporter